MMRSNLITRRRFLHAAAAGGVAYAFSRTPGIAVARADGADGFSDYKALVCIFLVGGNDSWNMVVPTSDAEYAVYAGSRQNLAVPKESLLPLNLAAADPDGWTFGLHPVMPGLAEMFNAGRAAVVANVGPLLTPTTLTQYRDRSVALPPQLFSHNDQQGQWHSLKGVLPLKTGWAGRVADLFSSQVTSQQVALNVSLSGQTNFQTGATSVPYTMGPYGPQPFYAFLESELPAGRREAFTALASASYGSLYQQALADVHRRALQFGDTVSAGLVGTPNFTALPDEPPAPLSPFAERLRTVAKLIAARDRLQMSRQIFFVATGGFDTHDTQAEDQPDLLSNLNDGLKRFDEAVQELGIDEQVVTFTQSDFGRTLTSNGDGTDHGWGGVQVVTGGAVAGGRIFGEYPLLRLGALRGTDRADDVDGGRFIPTLSSDQYVATLASWFGVDDADLATIAPNIGSFGIRNLGFLA